MAEKGEIPSDQVSLPPTYAPSETYTESPPPAYKRSGMAAVRVAKIVCVTLLIMTFLIGSAVVAHKWIQLRECNCSLQHETAHQQPLPLVAALVAGDLKEMKEEPIIKKSSTPLGESEMNENVLNLERDQEIKEMKKLKLPIDMLLGNPSLAGKNMPCNVEKRRQKIADGIFTEAVIVTCENEEKIDLPFSPFSPPGQGQSGPPPLSLISHIIKALASRPKSEIGNRENMNSLPNGFLKRPFPFGSPMPFPIRPNEGPRSVPFSPSMVHILPLKKMETGRPQPIPGMREMPPSFPHPFPPPFIKKISIRPLNLNQNGLKQLGAESIIRNVPKINILNAPPNFNPFLGGDGPQIKIIRTSNHDGENFEFPQKLPFPFPMNPAMKSFPIRKARVLRVMPSPIADHQAMPHLSDQEQNINEFHTPIEIINHDVDNLEEIVPEASGRSLPSPRVNLPGIKFIRFSNQPPPMMRFPGPRLMTHMELRGPPQEENEEMSDVFPPPVLPIEEEGEEFGPPKVHTVIQSAPEPIFRSGPPVIFKSPPEQSEEIYDGPELLPQTEPISLSQLQPRFFVPPPPRFAREGRFSPFAEMNPDAEVYTGPQNEQPNNHHLVLN